jgi:hypothetical protein
MLQRGLSLVGLLAWAVGIGFVAYVALRVMPTVTEYMTIQRAVDKIAALPASTVGDVKSAFDRQKEIEYSIQSISGKDLDVTKVNERVVVSFAYDKEIPLMGPVYILIRYQGRSK